MTLLNTDPQAKLWLHEEFAHVPRETWARLEAFTTALITASEGQNLIARTTFDHVWVRHVADSAQLIRHAPSIPGRWLDLGSGAGFPALIVAMLTDHRVTMVESRRLRIEFLREAAVLLGITNNVAIVGQPLERLPTTHFDVISARAFAPLARLLPLAHRFSTEKTCWLLPKGRSAQTELEQVSATWQGRFRLEPSLTDAEARIIVADQVRPRPGREEE